MSVQLPESFTITTGSGATYTVGGPSATASTTILNRFGFADDQDQAELHWRFVIEATSASDLATKRAAMLGALRQRYSKLTATFGSAQQFTFDPTTATSTGWDLEPSIRRAENWPHTALSEAWDYRARIALPPNFTDAYGAAQGRRSADANFHYDVNERTVVTLRGAWTQVPGTLARAQYLSQIDAYANYRLALIDPTAAWTVTRREESDPQSLSTLTWSREFSQVISGRRGSTRDPVQSASGLRLTTVRGTYLRTYGGSPQTATQNYTTDAATWVDTILAAIPSYEGGALTIGTDCEVISLGTPTNEQDDRLDFAWVIRELRVAQSTAATTSGVLDDPNIFNDSITLVIKRQPLGDSPDPPPITQNAAAAPSGDHTVSPPSPPSSPTPPTGGPTPVSQTTTSVVKPFDVFARYEATMLASVSDLTGYYENNIRPQLVTYLASALDVAAPSVQVEDSFSVSLQDAKITAEIHAQVVTATLIALRVETSVVDETGLHFDGVFNGVPYTFLVQPGLPDRTMVRLIRGFYLAGYSGIAAHFAAKPWSPGHTGWVLHRTSKPQFVTTIIGNVGLGYDTIAVTSETLVEEFRWVAANAGNGVTTTPNGGAKAPEPTGGNGDAPSQPTGAPDTPAPKIATGQG